MCQWVVNDDDLDFEPETPWETPSLSDTLQSFPYSLAAVDPSWNAMLLRHRKYWTGLPRVVFYVDSKAPTHIDDAKTLMQHMLYEPDPDTTYHQFHVAIIRHSKENPDDAAEKERVVKLMDLLAPEKKTFPELPHQCPRELIATRCQNLFRQLFDHIPPLQPRVPMRHR